jgi:hypothetical protein
MTDLLAMLADHGIQAKKAAGTKGGEWHSACPGCGGSDRFHVWPAQNDGAGSWWCRGCEKGGDAIQFLIEFDGLAYKAACERLGIEAKTGQGNTTRSTYLRAPALQPVAEPAKTADTAAANNTEQPESWRRKASDFRSWAASKLEISEQHRQWLAARGIDAAGIERFGLGYNPGDRGKDIFRHRTSWGLEDTGKKLWLPIGLVVPLTIGADTVRLRIRRETGEPRYYVVPGSSMANLWIDAAGARAIVVVESELDAMAIACQAPGLCGVCALGTVTRSFTAGELAILKSAAKILVALDFDKAGAKAWPWWEKTFADMAERWPVPVGKDPGEAFVAGVNLADWIRSGLPEAWNLAPVPKAQSASVPAATAAGSSLSRLAELVADSGVLIVCEATGRRIVYPPGWADQNRARVNDIYALVNYDKAVDAMLTRWDIPVVDADAVALAAKLMG